MWAGGERIDPSPTDHQAINGGHQRFEIQWSRGRTPRSMRLCTLRHVPSTFVHDLASRLRCEKCRQVGKRPAATLHQLAKLQRHHPGGET
jgi:hypothetical protein